VEHIQNLATEYGAYIYALIFIWTFFEGETFVIFCGFAASQDILSWTAVFLCAWLGSFFGDQLYFWIGRRWGTRLLNHMPRWRPGVELALDFLRRYNTTFILSFRFIYGVRNFASFAMGMSGLDPARFAFLNCIAACAWALSFAGFGYVFGEALETVLDDVIHIFGIFMLVFFSGAFALVFFLRRHHRREAARTAAAASAAAPVSSPTNS
jgi:membrane protein DedA with SNARE-associated domain